MTKQVLIFDPVPYKGGSKKVAQSVLSTFPENLSVVVVSNDKLSWQPCNVEVLPLYSVNFLVNKTEGLGYFLKHFFYSLVLLYYFIKRGTFSKVIGISGPTVDLSLYVLSIIVRCEVIQLVQGNVPETRIAAYGLKKAYSVHYLQSTEASIKNALVRSNSFSLLNSPRFNDFVNSVDANAISKKQENSAVGVLWAASLLPWKRLELFVEAFKELDQQAEHILSNYYGDACFIVAKNNDVIAPSRELYKIKFQEDPKDLDHIRANSSIFVSTSIKEPFGLSILESMVAGLTIVIPKDGAYWDKHLTHGINCLKFDANNPQSLCFAILTLINDGELRNRLAKNSQQFARGYTNLKCYSKILNSIIN